ncbi:MAG: B12-binding domain-containing radical SAM protein [Nanoarchaeota archaeon]
MEKKALLVTMTRPSLRGLFLDNGLALLASILKSNHYPVKILDLCVTDSIPHISNWINYSYERIKSEIEEFDPIVIGWKTWINECAEQIEVQKKISKEYPEILMVNGGPHISLFSEFFEDYLDRKNGGFTDVLFRHTGEQLPDMLNLERQEWHNIQGITYKFGKIMRTLRSENKNLDNLPIGSYDEETYPAVNENQKIKFLYRNANVGCSHAKCNFCSHPFISGNYSEHSLDYLINESKYFINNGFFLQRFGNSTTPPKLANKFSEAHIRNKLGNIIFAFQGNINFGKEYDFPLIKKSGTNAIFYGAESADQKELDLWDKRTSSKEIEETVKRTADAGIMPVLSFIYTGDNNAAKKTMDLILKLKPAGITWFPLLPMPHTDVIKNPEKYNVELQQDYLRKLFKSTLNLTKKFTQWEELPYSVNGKSHLTLLNEINVISEILEKENIPTRVSDESLLIANILEEPIDKIKRLECSQNYEELKAFVSEINNKIKEIRKI